MTLPPEFEFAVSISQTHREALAWLYDAVASMQLPIYVVEVGSWEGGSAIVLALASRATDGPSYLSREIHCVDDFSFRDGKEGPIPVPPSVRLNFLRNTSAYPEIFLHEEGSPAFACRMPARCADLIYIDGRHDYASMILDIRTWWPKIKPGGIFCGHDYGGEPDGVGRAVREHFYSLPITFPKGDLWAVQKPMN